jgi:hypothetical protein
VNVPLPITRAAPSAAAKTPPAVESAGEIPADLLIVAETAARASEIAVAAHRAGSIAAPSDDESGAENTGAV